LDKEKKGERDMNGRTRRDFLRQVGAGALTAGVGSALAADLGFLPAFAGQEADRLTFGPLEPLVSLMQETPIAKLQALLVGKVKAGEATLKDLVAAAALANARTFGGDDYVGFHSMFAFMPAYSIAQELPPERKLLPVLKALYRNSNRIQEFGGRAKEVLGPVAPAALPEGKCGAEAIRDAVRGRDLKGAEKTLAGLCERSPKTAFHQVQAALHDSTEVHRVNLVWRAWGLLDIVGLQHAHTLLRQSLHYFVAQEGSKNRDHFSGARTLLPKLLDQYRLCEGPSGTRVPDDAGVEQMSVSLFASSPERAAEIAAGALAEGVSPQAVHEAISLAANQLVLRDENKQAHGSTVGVHCSDAVNAWRHIGSASEGRNAAAAAIMAAYNFAFDRDNPKRNKFQEWSPYPRPEAREQVQSSDPADLLRELEGAIRGKDQARAAAAVARLGELDAPAAPVFSIFRGYVVSQHGSLHGEKYFRTVTEEFEATRARFRWRQLVGMARYAASMYGEPSPGYEEALRLLGLPG
jgi:hypothetical protein